MCWANRGPSSRRRSSAGWLAGLLGPRPVRIQRGHQRLSACLKNGWQGRPARAGRRPADRNERGCAEQKADVIGRRCPSVRRVAGRHRKVAWGVFSRERMPLACRFRRLVENFVPHSLSRDLSREVKKFVERESGGPPDSARGPRALPGVPGGTLKTYVACATQNRILRHALTFLVILPPVSGSKEQAREILKDRPASERIKK